MAGEQLRNLGVNSKTFIFVNGVKLNRDFTQITKSDWDYDFYEGIDEYIGRGDIVPWQLVKGAHGSFDFEEANAGTVHAIIDGINQSNVNGTRPDIQIVERIENNDGTTNKITFRKVQLHFKKANAGKGEKLKWSVTWIGSNNIKPE